MSLDPQYLFAIATTIIGDKYMSVFKRILWQLFFRFIVKTNKMFVALLNELLEA